MKAFGARESRGEFVQSVCALNAGVVNRSTCLVGAFEVFGCFLPWLIY